MVSIPAEKLRKFALKLYEIDGIKFGDFVTKVGLYTPVYVDLRVIVSYPDVMEMLADLLAMQLKVLGQVDRVCGVPYTALPIATILSAKTNVPMVMRRREAKGHGTKKLIEGKFEGGMNCLIIEDVVTSGSSILETVKDLRDVGLNCTDVLVLLNREQGGAVNLENNGIRMHALVTTRRLMKILKEEKKIDEEIERKVLNYIQDNQIDFQTLGKVTTDRLQFSYESRAKISKHSVATELFTIMATKETNLCFAADVDNSAQLLRLAECVGPYICMLKTHIDIVEDFSPNLIDELKRIAQKHNFMLFEDRKFADIGKTVEYQYSKGIYRISSWAKLVTAHSLMGRGVLDAIKQSPGEEKAGVFLLAEASSSGSLIDERYTKETVKLALEYPEILVGIVCQTPLFTDKPEFIQLTPGVQLGSKNDNFDQQYDSPEHVIMVKGADVAVVGRGISGAADPALAAKEYKCLLWEAYLKRIQV